MRVSVAIAAGWIGFYLADFALFDGYYAMSTSRLVRAIADGLGFQL
jgi:hypothetical protein